MAAVAQEYKSHPALSSDDESEPEWGLDAIKMWWNPSCNKACKKAETGIVRHFLDDSIFECKSQQVPIHFDPEPQSIKQKRLQRSQTFSNLFSFGSSKCSCESNSDKLISDKPDNNNPVPKHARSSSTSQNIASSASKSTGALAKDSQYLHTLTVRIKQDQLNKFSASKRHATTTAAKQSQVASNKTPNKDTKGKTLSHYFVRKQAKKCASFEGLQDQLLRIRSDGHSAKQKRLCPLVMMHGYGTAGGYFIPSIPIFCDTLLSHLALEQAPEIHVVDWLGNGMSSRPSFECADTAETEDWFVDSLEAWRRTMGIEKMILCGHSLGGYMSCVYAMKYPQRIEHLVLISPVGVPEMPQDYESKFDAYSWKVRTMFKSIRSLWDAGWTPHDIVRLSGPKGKSLIQKLVQRRLHSIPDENPLKGLLAEYLYHVIAQQGSGEYALNKILAPGAFAKEPLVNRMGVLKKHQKDVSGYESYDVVEEKGDGNESEEESIDVDCVMNSNLKIDFIYGEQDWMGSDHGIAVQQAGTIKCEVYVNPNCGHQLMLENTKGFAQLLAGIIAKGQILS